ncbi:hypothetical protein EYB53_003765 [Candidatus Chloroploca sp. M-50]|uniref:Core-binding (CB) domain-containing protein n=1 Tax=Candidatus Chloroploca mongolica TaxID=2528176 RepID=A0ABS4D5V5_9CHLR|nr:hypothetical protein [Candidatus Chloroploca mongolica]MBP1464821.1 hypothetical protein [Candidatus Chloroploca mongolica]
MTYHEPTIASILRLLAEEHQGSVDERTLLDQVLTRRPSSAKNPYATIRDRLRWDGLTLGWVRLSRTQLIPLRIALQDLTFRCQPRDCDLADGLLPVVHLQPFAGLRAYDCLVQDTDGALLPLLGIEQEEFRHPSLPAVDLRAWYERTGFNPGDSIIVTVITAQPVTMRLEHEPYTALRNDAVKAQDTELIDAIVERVRRSQVALVPCDEIVLPIFAAASWRTTYPGTPWQYLVLNDRRLQLVDDIFLTTQHLPVLSLFGHDEVFEAPPQSEQALHAADAALLAEIDALQKELRYARQHDAEAGLWSGQIQRASARFGRFEHTEPGQHSLLGGLEDALYDGMWELDDPWLGEEYEPDPTRLVDTHIYTLEEIQERIFAILPPRDVERLREARPEEAEVIVASHLNRLLVQAPELFPRIDHITPVDYVDHAVTAFDDDEDWHEAWNDDEADDEELDLYDDSDDDFEDQTTLAALDQSGDLIGQFYDYLREMGKRDTTARVRSRALYVYAEFLATFYGRTLAEGDYATLDECLFFYYPQSNAHTSERQVRELCTAIKQLYAFLKERGVIFDNRFAEALWRRRDQAAKVIALYERIPDDSPGSEVLVTNLFFPYIE